MKAEQQQEFIKQLNENQRIIHKFVKSTWTIPVTMKTFFRRL